MAASRRNNGNILKRRRWKRNPYSRFLIVCEGRNTEPDYFTQYRKHCRGLVEIISIGLGKMPQQLLDEADRRRIKANRDSKKQKDENLKYEEVWCVFDVDGEWEKRDIRNTIVRARTLGIGLAISNPCFELWALLHFVLHDRPSTPDETIKELCKYLGKTQKDKKLPVDMFHDNYELAVSNATELCKRRRSDSATGSINDNPSTTVHLLTELIRENAARNNK